MTSHFDDVTDTIPLPPMPSETALRSGHEGSEADEFQRDRFRLGQEVAREFEDISDSRLGYYGKGDNTADMGPSFMNDVSNTDLRQLHPDIERKYGGHVPGQNFLQQTPTVNSKVMQTQFSDFTMPGRDRDSGDDSFEMEVGRGYDGGRTHSLLNNTTDFFSMNGATGARNDRRTNSGRTEGLSTSTPRMPRNQIRKQPNRANGSPLPKAQSPPLEFSPSAAHKRASGAKSRGSPTRPIQSSKIMDIVSSEGSSGSKNKQARRTYEDGDDALSDRERERPSNYKGSRNPAPPQSTGKNFRGDNFATKARREKESGAVPRSFKSTPDFLKELGLEGHTTTNLQMKLDGLKDPQPRARSAPNPAPVTQRDVTFSGAQNHDITDLFSGNEVTRFSAKRVGFSPSHAAIESIPIPHDSRALLEGMQELQEKVATLERARSSQRTKVSKLEADLKRAEARYQQSQRPSKPIALDHDITLDSTMDDDEEAEAREKARMHWMMDKLRMQSVIEQLQKGIDKATRDLDGAQHALETMQSSHRIAVKSVAAAISSREDMRAANRDLEAQLANLELNRQQAEAASIQQQEQNELRVAKLKKRVRDARMAASAAEQALLESTKQKLSKEQSRVPDYTTRNVDAQRRPLQSTAIQQSEFDKLVREELMRTRPDLFRNQSSPISIPHGADSPVKSKRVHIASKIRSPRSMPVVQAGLTEFNAKGSGHDCSHVSDGSCASISPEEIRQIAKDLSMDRKRRKAANAPKESRPTACVEKENNHRIFKVVYLVDKNGSEDSSTHKKQNEEVQALAPSSASQPEVSPLQPELNSGKPSNADTSYLMAPEHVFPSHDHPAPEHEYSNIDHNRDRCTVCQRYDRLRRMDEIAAEDNPLAMADTGISLNGDSADPTIRPSADPQEQLKYVLRQLKDEYHHLQIDHSYKAQELLECKPEVRSRRRKALQQELKELVNQINTKADQIYALCDVDQDFCARPQNGSGNVLGDQTVDLIRSLSMDAGH